MATSDRREYLTATTLDQAFLDRSQDNLENGLTMAADIQAPDGSTLRISDRNTYVGGTFYQALTKFPVIKRTLGDWLSPAVQFSSLQLELSNVDGRFTSILPGGAGFGGWIGKSVQVSLGLRDVASTFEPIYQGVVTDIGGAKRDRVGITLITRDKFDKVNNKFPTQVFTVDSFPFLEDGLQGTVVPVIYGDWTVRFDANGASVPAYVINGNSTSVLAGTADLEFVVASHSLRSLDAANVFLKRSSKYYKMDTGDVTVHTGNASFAVKQASTGGTTMIEGVAFLYQSGDAFYVRVKGKDLGAYSENIVWQARDILITYGLVSSASFDANWATYRDKSTPAESAVATFKSRAWVQTQQSVILYALSMLEQVRLESFISKDLLFKITSLHLDEFQASPAFTISNWDIAAGTLKPELDDKNIWNRALGSYGFEPALNVNAYATPIFKNQAAIAQAGKLISKEVTFPNLYEAATVILQLKEMLKLASGYPEMIDLTLTPRALKQELGGFVKLNIAMGSTVFQNVPAMIREIGYDPSGMKLPMRVWSMQMTPFPGYAPGYAGIVGGSTATITQET
jgi:hypothetical protein